jgi:hypothetical protein
MLSSPWCKNVVALITAAVESKQEARASGLFSLLLSPFRKIPNFYPYVSSETEGTVVMVCSHV